MMSAAQAAQLVQLMDAAVLWLKVLSVLSPVSFLAALLWAVRVERRLDDIAKFTERHDDTLHEMSKTESRFSGLFSALRSLEVRLLETRRRSRQL